MITCYPGVGKKKGLAICEAFAEGARAQGAAARVQPPGTAIRLAGGAAFFYGTTPDNEFLLQQAVREGLDWLYADNAYWFGRGRFFRVTRRALQHDGRGPATPAGAARWAAFAIPVRPWQRGGRRIVVATQSDLWHRKRHGMGRAAWANGVRAQLMRFTDRPVELCLKPEAAELAPGQAHSPRLEALLADAWVCVVHSSSAAVAALIAGVPVITLADCCATAMGRKSLAEVETPLYPEDRARWLAVLAANQWTREELRDGTCWKALEEQRERAAA